MPSREGQDEGLPKFTIQMKPQSKPLSKFPPGMQQAVSNDYAVQYLDRIGVSPSRENITLLLREMPLRKCHVGATWRTKGWLKDQFIIIPDGKARPDGDTAIHEETLAPQTSDDDGSSKSGNGHGYYDRGISVAPALLEATVDNMVGEVSKMLKDGVDSHSHQKDKDYLKSIQNKHLNPYNEAHKPSIEDNKKLHMRGREDVLKSKARSKQSTELGPGALAEARRRSSVAFSEILQPLEVTSDSLQAIHDDFVRIFPFHQFRIKLTATKKKALEGTLTSPELIRLSGLLCHYLYWNIARPLVATEILAVEQSLKVETSESNGNATNLSGLNNEERERLFLDMMRAFNRMQSTTRDLQVHTNMALACVLLSLRTAVDRVFCTAYRWFRMRGEHEARAVDLLTTMQQEVTRLMDPQMYCTRIAELGSSRIAMQLIHSQKRSSHLSARGCYHTTSSATRTLFPRPKSVGARRILHKPGKPSTLEQLVDTSGGGNCNSSCPRVQRPPPTEFVFTKSAVKGREILDTEKQTRLYASVLAKLRQQYVRAYSRTDDKHLLEREIMLEPINAEMVEHHNFGGS